MPGEEQNREAHLRVLVLSPVHSGYSPSGIGGLLFCFFNFLLLNVLFEESSMFLCIGITYFSFSYELTFGLFPAFDWFTECLCAHSIHVWGTIVGSLGFVARTKMAPSQGISLSLIYLSYLSIYLSIHLSIYLSIHHLSINYLSIIHLHMYPSIYLSIRRGQVDRDRLECHVPTTPTPAETHTSGIYKGPLLHLLTQCAIIGFLSLLGT